MKFIGIIPVRYASTRFPANPLAIYISQVKTMGVDTLEDLVKTEGFLKRQEGRA